MQIDNIFSRIPQQLPDELVEVVLTNQHLRLERIISKGHASPEGFWYDQDEHEWVLLLQGEAILMLEDSIEPIKLTSGMYINLPAHVKHRVEWTSPEVETIWLALFY